MFDSAAVSRQGEEGEYQQKKAEQNRRLPAASSVILFGHGFAQAESPVALSIVFDTIYRQSAVMPNGFSEKKEKFIF